MDRSWDSYTKVDGTRKLLWFLPDSEFPFDALLDLRVLAEEYRERVSVAPGPGASTIDMDVLASALDKAADLLSRPAIRLGAQDARKYLEVREYFPAPGQLPGAFADATTLQGDLAALERIRAVVAEMQKGFHGIPSLRASAITVCVRRLAALWTKAGMGKPTTATVDNAHCLTPFTTFALSVLSGLDGDVGEDARRDADRLRRITNAVKGMDRENHSADFSVEST